MSSAMIELTGGTCLDLGYISIILGVNGSVTFSSSKVELSTSVDACKLELGVYS